MQQSLQRQPSTVALPNSCRTVVIISIMMLGVAFYHVCTHAGATLWLALIAFFISGFLADLFTGLAHFGFDYVFPDEMPILGPISKEFRQHHNHPTLDPSNYVVNFTKGSYGSLPVSITVCILSYAMNDGWISFLTLSTLLGTSFWAFFFHQIHSYAHMGSHLSATEFNLRVAQIARLPSQKEQRQEFDRLFEGVPIPPVIRFLQRHRIILDPKIHNLHHLYFETDFSSVNGWSDPVMNPILGPIARRIKARSEEFPL